MTQVYITDCLPLADEEIIRRLLPRMDQRRQQKIRTLQTVNKQAQTVAAGLLLEHCFGPDTCYQYGENGKPYLSDERAYFSISHSAQWVALAVSGTNIGADIQVISPIRPSVLRRCFTEAEQTWIGMDAERFTQMWTQKEAYAKYIGCGITAPLITSTPSENSAHFTNRYANTFISVFGDDTVKLVPINIKDLL